MRDDIPPEFEKNWDMADVVLHTEDSGERKLHANKSMLALFSPYFRGLFYHGFIEKDITTVFLNCGIDTMKEILKIIHQVDFNYSSKGHIQYNDPLLVELYRVAVVYNFPIVRKLCLDQVDERPGVRMVMVAIDLGNYNSPKSGDIPPDFEKRWDFADVVLRTEDSDGRNLYANKSALSVFSTYFRALFFHGFKEQNDAAVSVDCGCATMKEILKIIHQVDIDYLPESYTQYEATMLIDLYRVADIYDFPTVRKLCLDQINDRPNVEKAKVALELDFHDMLMNTVENMTSEQAREFTNLENVNHMFSKKDIQLILKKIIVRPLAEPKRTNSAHLPPFLICLSYMTKNPQFDLTRPWEKSNVAIITKSSVLYGNLEVIDMVSRNFKAKVLPMSSAQLNTKKWFVNTDDRIKYVAEIDIEFATMMEILSVIHRYTDDYLLGRNVNPQLLYDMYRAADADQLDIPMIRKICLGMLRDINPVDAWEVTCRLFGVDLESPMYKSLSPSERHHWIYRQDNYLSYTSYSGVVVITLAQTEPLCNLRMVNKIISDILEW